MSNHKRIVNLFKDDDSRPLPPSYFGNVSADGAYPQAFGVEVELENFILRDDQSPKDIGQEYHCWGTTTDGSLRNSGIELISVPFFIDAIDQVESEFNDILKKSLEMPEASARCGVHVHVDAFGWTVPELCNVLMMYLVVERALFAVSGNRDSSNFCVPLNASEVHGHLLRYAQQGSIVRMSPYRAILNLSDTTRKYSALNLNPLMAQGTIEFRHHEGTDDFKDIRNWIKCISNLVKISRGFSSFLECMNFIVELNTNSAYTNLLHRLFEGTPFTNLADSSEQCSSIRKAVLAIKLRYN